MNLFIGGVPVVSLPAEKLFDIGPIHFTNSMMLGIIGVSITFWLFWYTKSKIQSNKHTRVSIAMLWMLSLIHI